MIVETIGDYSIQLQTVDCTSAVWYIVSGPKTPDINRFYCHMAAKSYILSVIERDLED